MALGGVLGHAPGDDAVELWPEPGHERARPRGLGLTVGEHRHAACLTLVLNAIVTWNTRYIQAAVDHVRTTRPELVTDQALARLAPVLHAHINPYGRYFFDLAALPALGHLRPLNAIAARVDSEVPTTPIPSNRD
jgi:hypothetical protein